MAPLTFLKNAASQYSKISQENRRLDQEDRALLFDLLSHTKSFQWKSAYFRKGRGVSIARMEAVVDAVFYEPKARMEVRRAIDKLGGRGGRAFWDLYLRRVHNAIVGFSVETLSFLKFANSALPKQGQITDWHSGAGNLAAALSLAVPERRVLAVDSNPRAVIATKRLYRHFFPDGLSIFHAKLGSPVDPQLSIPVSQGAVLHNGLFLLETDSAKKDFLKEIAANLLNNGVFLLVEPKPGLQKQSLLRLWLLREIRSAVEAHSPVSEFEIALFVEFQRRLFLEAPSRFLGTKEWIELAKEAGFGVQLVRDIFHGQYSALLFHKIPTPPKPKKEPLIRYHDDPWPKGE